ncbi:MAG: hypothetical protein WCH85_04355 [Methanomicrobiales archaeon]
MPEICPHCGKESVEVSPRFCSSCGARMDGTPPYGFLKFPGVLNERKNANVAGFCSSVLPGLGQVYNGETVKGYLFFLLAILGLFVLLIPGLLIWLYAMYDAYAIAGKMNTGEMEVREMKMTPMILFIVFAAVVIIGILAVVITLVMGNLMTRLGPLGTTDYSWMCGKKGII